MARVDADPKEVFRIMWSWHEEQCENMVKTGKFPIPENRRASGDVLCAVCHRPYHMHPRHIPYWDLTILCNGDHVHL